MTFFNVGVRIHNPNVNYPFINHFSSSILSFSPTFLSHSPISFPFSNSFKSPTLISNQSASPISTISGNSQISFKNSHPFSNTHFLTLDGADSVRILKKLSPFVEKSRNFSRNVRASGFFQNFGKPKMPEIVQAGDPVLHEPALEVPLEDIGSPEIEKIIEDMILAMRTAPGVGLAGPQLGYPLQIIVLEDTEELMSYSTRELSLQQEREPFSLLVIINPKLRLVGDKCANFFEGCLSVRGYRGIVKRHLAVELTGFDRKGNLIKMEARGWQARILQHECDHLDGTLYVDKMTPKTFRAEENFGLPLAKSCPEIGVCNH